MRAANTDFELKINCKGGELFMEETLIKLCKAAQLLESHVDPNSDEFIFVGNFVSALSEAAQSFEELAQNCPELAREIEFSMKESGFLN